MRLCTYVYQGYLCFSLLSLTLTILVFNTGCRQWAGEYALCSISGGEYMELIMCITYLFGRIQLWSSLGAGFFLESFYYCILFLCGMRDWTYIKQDIYGRDVSMVKSIYYACKGPEFRSSHPHDGSWLPLTPVLAIWRPLLAFMSSCTRVVCMYPQKHTPTHENK